MTVERNLQAAADAVRSADALLVGAGAGMGVDSGLPDFRGAEGFWKAYPPFRGKQFHELSTPHWFQSDPALAWGFFGHRLNLYRTAVPHEGFHVLKRWGARMPNGMFVFTSNVDGQFQKAGFDSNRILECHGSIRFLQCSRNCGSDVRPSDGVEIDVDEVTIRARSAPPTCLGCGAVARPNILMFGDWDWDQARFAEQQERYEDWLRSVQGKRVVSVEIGAGLAIPTVRLECERRAEWLIRVNPREPETRRGVSLPLGALDALTKIDAILDA